MPFPSPQVLRRPSLGSLLLLGLLSVCSGAQESAHRPYFHFHRPYFDAASHHSSGHGLTPDRSAAPPLMELSRPIRPAEFLDAVGMRAGLLGRESGQFEAWIYPLKLLRNFHLVLHTGGHAVPAEKLARWLIVKPESSTIVYGSDSFEVRETLIVPPREAGAIIRLEIHTFAPLQIEAGFERDFQLMWPAAIGGTYMNWDEKLHAFTLGEEQKKYFGLVGSPSVTQYSQESYTNSFSQATSGFLLSPVPSGSATQVIVIAGSLRSQSEALETYHRLSTRYIELEQQAADYYRQYLDRTVQLDLPDRDLQKAYDWSRISTITGLVENPFLGTGLVAGYRTSGNDARPGFAWMFGRDALWTALALDAEGDFATVRTALDFLAKFQREDGKVEHEISQSAGLVDWFKNFPYGYASADSTPLYIIAANDYVTTSGDLEFARRHWNNLAKAYDFLRSTYDSQGLAQNLGVGHGWVEGGPLLPVKNEFYQSALGVEALRSLSHLAQLTGREELHHQLQQEFSRKQPLLDRVFWSAENNFFTFARDKENLLLPIPTVLSTVPMWFDLVDEQKAGRTITELSRWEHSTDWGMRLISARDPRFDPTGYHFGSVWPLFTGWAAVGEYKEHRATAAYANLRANALLALDGAAGRVTEVLSGTYYSELATSSPHQIWSSAMVISPLLRGLLGLENQRTEHRLIFAPHIPGLWQRMEARNLPACDGAVSLAYVASKGDSSFSEDAIELQVQRTGSGDCAFEFSPAVSPRAKVTSVEINGRAAPFSLVNHAADQHVRIRFALTEGRSDLRIRLRDNFQLSVPADLPPLAATSSNLKVVSENWSVNRDHLELQVSGVPGNVYEIAVTGAKVASVKGEGPISVEYENGFARNERVRIIFASAATQNYVEGRISLSFN